MNERAIGVFDSGVGGLTVLRALEQTLPFENFLYFGDTARAPYGGRQPTEIRSYAAEIGRWLISRGCKMIIVACNTTTTLGMDALKAATMAQMPVYGMLEAVLAAAFPDVRSASEEAPWPMGLIATEGTVNSGVYQNAVEERAPGKPFYAQACPSFVPLVERGAASGREVAEKIAFALSPLREKGIRRLILGCTHYPFLAGEIASYLGGGVRLADPAVYLASMMEIELHSHAMRNDRSEGAPGAREFWCSGDAESFRRIGGKLLGRPIESVRTQTF